MKLFLLNWVNIYLVDLLRILKTTKLKWNQKWEYSWFHENTSYITICQPKLQILCVLFPIIFPPILFFTLTIRISKALKSINTKFNRIAKTFCKYLKHTKYFGNIIMILKHVKYGRLTQIQKGITAQIKVKCTFCN